MEVVKGDLAASRKKLSKERSEKAQLVRVYIQDLTLWRGLALPRLCMLRPP